MSKTAQDFWNPRSLEELGIYNFNNGTSTGSDNFSSGEELASYSPVDGALIGKVRTTSKADYEKVMDVATNAFKIWKTKPAPLRGEIVRQFGDKLRELKEPLGRLVFL